MTFNSQSPKTPRTALRLIARFYRFMGWLGLLGTVLIGIHAFSDIWIVLNTDPADYVYRPYSEHLAQSIVNMALFICLGLFFSGAAFLVSVFLEGGVVMTANTDKQTELLRQLIRDHDNEDDRRLTRLTEHEQENAESQTTMPQQRVHRSTGI